MKIKLLLASSFLLSATAFLNAQTVEERRVMTQEIDKDQLQLATQEISRYESAAAQRALNYSTTHNVPLRSYDENGNLIILQDVDIKGNPVFTSTYNLGGVITIGADHLYPNGSLGVSATGNGITAGIWDGGYSRPTHQDLTGRVALGEPNKAIDGHGTHVGGTIIGSGVGGRARKGVAYEADLLSFEFDSDSSEMLVEAQAGMLVSNHSYGRLLTGNIQPILGKYDSFARVFDIITSLNEFYLPVVSAGNDRNAGFNTGDLGYDLLTDRSLSKNSLTIGAVNSVINYSGPASVTMSSFSSWGPTDDSRIKPDLVAKGVSVNSTESQSDSAYGTRSGTSMSSPMVTGGILLLHDLYNQINSSFLKSASMKGLLLMTTKEAGANPGPDYSFGWGLMDVEAAGEFIQNLDNSTLIDERNLIGSVPYTRTVTSNQPTLKVGIVWTDFQGNVNSNQAEDDTTPALINDLDIKLTDAQGQDYFPWKLDAANFRLAATKGINDVDNVEIVEIIAPAGTYTITVSNKGTLRGGNENYTLLISGADTGTLSTPTEVLDSIKLFPNPASDYVNLTMNGQLSGSKIQVNIFDTLGKRVINRSYDNASSFEQRINTSSLDAGIYIVKVTDGEASTTKKLIIR
jgi:hypothetical protein